MLENTAKRVLAGERQDVECIPEKLVRRESGRRWGRGGGIVADNVLLGKLEHGFAREGVGGS